MSQLRTVMTRFVKLLAVGADVDMSRDDGCSPLYVVFESVVFERVVFEREAREFHYISHFNTQLCQNRSLTHIL